MSCLLLHFDRKYSQDRRDHETMLLAPPAVQVSTPPHCHVVESGHDARGQIPLRTGTCRGKMGASHASNMPLPQCNPKRSRGIRHGGGVSHYYMYNRALPISISQRSRSKALFHAHRATSVTLERLQGGACILRRKAESIIRVPSVVP